MSSEAYQNAVNELYSAMNAIFLANNRLYAAAYIVCNWEVTEMHSVNLEGFKESDQGTQFPPTAVVEEANSDTMRNRWDSSWDATIQEWLEVRRRRRETLSQGATFETENLTSYEHSE
jgi:hypothetical protein